MGEICLVVILAKFVYCLTHLGSQVVFKKIFEKFFTSLYFDPAVYYLLKIVLQLNLVETSRNEW